MAAAVGKIIGKEQTKEIMQIWELYPQKNI